MILSFDSSLFTHLFGRLSSIGRYRRTLPHRRLPSSREWIRIIPLIRAGIRGNVIPLKQYEVPGHIGGQQILVLELCAANTGGWDVRALGMIDISGSTVQFVRDEG